ncbi:MAG TPA: fumarylacetoacetate hydrolase family protein [Acidobacteriaceae bacterium]|nr:fumarylacetoacetate hydrolase family protein [Acidobacteriaceae bacterium]
MKIVTFSLGGGHPRPGTLVDETIVDLSRDGVSNVLDLIRHGHDGVDGPAFPVAEAQLLAPILNPPRIFCIGLNYRDHAIESKMEIPAVPTVFLKLASAIIGPGAPVVLPKNSTQPDYEVEFAVVIGKGGFRIAADAWREHVFGYTILNDVSARDIQLATSQWTLGKSFPGFCPIGPAIVTADEIPDPHALDIRLAIDGEEMQHSNTRELIFRVPQLIEYISSVTPLEPGDIISTGTPQGVGLGRNPKRWLRPGETIVAEVAGLGKLVNRTVAES